MAYSVYRKRNIPDRFPRCIEFQTITACNSQCICCPHKEIYANKKALFMPDAILYKILNELSEHKDEMELIIPYFNNEPFLDKRILEILRFVKKEVNIDVELSSNGSLLSEYISDALVEENLVQNMRFSFFGMFAETYEKRMQGLSFTKSKTNIAYFLDKKGKNNNIHSEIIMIQQPGLVENEISLAKEYFAQYSTDVKVFGYLDRAGKLQSKNQIPIGANRLSVIGCELNRPFERMVINVLGDCVLCSQDWTGQCLLGNISISSLEAIWAGNSAKTVRKQISGVVASESSFLCRKCKLAILG